MLSGIEPAMKIEELNSEEEIETLFKDLRNTWQTLGATEPYWSVLSSDKFKI